MTWGTWGTWGAFGFGAVIGWYLYYINRYRSTEVKLHDLTSVIAIIGGGAILAIFSPKTKLFGAYGVGLAVGFFAYFLVLLMLVASSASFTWDWFIDGRRPNPPAGWGFSKSIAPTVRPMAFHSLWSTSPHPLGETNVGTEHSLSLAPGEFERARQTMSEMPAEVLVRDRLARVRALLNSDKVITICRDVWPAKRDKEHSYHDNCNWFAVEVASRLHVALSGVADSIVDEIATDGWTRIATGPAASDEAAKGRFVVCGVKSEDFTPPREHGHVAIVVAGPLNPGGWAPAGYWGSDDPKIASRGDRGLPISWCFKSEDKDKIYYAARDF